MTDHPPKIENEAMNRFIKGRRSGFSIIELMIVVAIIGILAAIVTINFMDIRMSARDANRRESVEAYSTSLEQWKSASKTQSYFVQVPIDNICTVNGDGVSYMIADPESLTIVLGLDGGSTSRHYCVGYKGGGAGRLTRKESPDLAKYRNSSIAEALREGGVLTAIKPDPSDRGDYTKKESGNDFVLTLCNASGDAATSIKDAKEFAIYAHYEKSNPSDSSVFHSTPDKINKGTMESKQPCGSLEGGKSWDIEASW